MSSTVSKNRIGITNGNWKKLGNVHLALEFCRFSSFRLISLKKVTVTEKVQWVALSVYTFPLERF
jgi:hypothetical protein